MTPSPLQTFAGSSARFATAEATASLLGHGISARLANHMLTTARLHAQLERALRDKLGTCPPELTPVQTHIAGLLPVQLTRLALRAGAVWHARLIASIYEGPAVRALVERIGADFRETALQDIGSGAAPRAAEEKLEIADLPAAIARDGAACLVAWCEAQPREVGWRILLRLRVSARPSTSHADLGPKIVERVAA